MASNERSTDNPYGKLMEYPKADPLEMDDPKEEKKEEEEEEGGSSVSPAAAGLRISPPGPEHPSPSRTKTRRMLHEKTSKPFSQPRYQTGKLGPIPKGMTPYGLTRKAILDMSRGEYHDILWLAEKDWRLGDKTAFQKPQTMLRRTGTATRAAASRALGALGPASKLASRAAGPVGLALGAHDIYRGVQDPDFMTGLINLFGGEEAAYNAWAAQEAKEGRDRPSYEEYTAKSAEMEPKTTDDTD